jgi:hypothetical protein
LRHACSLPLGCSVPAPGRCRLRSAAGRG